jgi:hypothetical protein
MRKLMMIGTSPMALMANGGGGGGGKTKGVKKPDPVSDEVKELVALYKEEYDEDPTNQRRNPEAV